MSDDRTRILDMLAAGKISVDEAEKLLDALDARARADDAGAPAEGATADTTPGGGAIKGDPTPLVNALPKYLYVKVDSDNGDRVDVKVPIALVRSGLKLPSLIPDDAMGQVNDSLEESGITIDFSNLKPQDIDELVAALRETEITVDAKNGDKVRVYAA